MRKMLLVAVILITASFVLTSCDPAANTGNRAANAPANGANTNTAPVADKAAIEAEIKKAVADTATALAKNDIAALEKIYHEDYMLVNLDGSVQNRADRLASMKSGETKFDSFAYDEVTVRSNPEGTGAIAISRVNATGVNKGRKIEGYVRVTHVWRKTKDGWRMVTGHATQITGTAATPAKTDDTSKTANTNAAKPPANN